MSQQSKADRLREIDQMLALLDRRWDALDSEGSMQREQADIGAQMQKLREEKAGLEFWKGTPNEN